ncbi:hypothetical protein J4E85_010835 [Alternaria conjuncta]|uniref:uncharacterized protein n=1 Tax=Alternaria conjuncta TaxID=181017 RepID=UPI00221FE682|nr:uncharacterized protein J4E85_010835 [Alternaria conjuncta]KAI4913381.1 hypothetical protein J4E85_010835 [Alternaria conjuncta]
MVNWTADKDQIILKGIFKFHDIKSSAPLLKYLSEEIGGDCTPKAVSHRLTNIRKGGTTSANAGTVASPRPAASKPKTPRSKAKPVPRKEKAVSEDADSDGPQGLMDDDEILSPTASRGKRTLNGKRKPTYDETSDKEEEEEVEVEDEYVPMAKRVKEEPVDEEGVVVEELAEEEV